MNIDEFRALKEKKKLARQERHRRAYQKKERASSYNVRMSRTRAIKEASREAGVSPSSVHKWVTDVGLSIEDAVKRVLGNRKQMNQYSHKVGAVVDADVINRFLTGGTWR